MGLKEPLNGLLHLFGAVLAIPATILLIVKSGGHALNIVAFSLYGFTLFMLYFWSTMYHWLPQNAGGKNQVFRKFDHLSIYALIAGTYTPFCLITLDGAWGWGLFGAVWGLAVAGIALQSVFINLPRWLTTTVYVLMGWLIVVAIKPLLVSLDARALPFLIGGGVVYSVGGVVYTLKKPNLGKYFGFHELWHIMVLAGSVLHFLAMLLYV
ncbi:hemolysin III family protein [Candidatus Termititenax persephonae]|uniref:Hemolysin III family protein n=1 Tax=Candidatus Termititenax persephonae TaxID=2218525 RepID=A0A388TIP7_9BACT|nr:hemolysin III family protein [Candidatus Termititenax persephonae]